MKQEYSKKRFFLMLVAVVLSVFAVVSGVTAATTISTNIVTGGDLTVSGATTLVAVTTSGLITSSGTLKVGSSGTTLTQIIKGTCTSFNGAGLNSIDGSQPATSTRPYDCAVTGVVAGDVVIAQFATSTASQANGNIPWQITGAKASTTAGFITVLIFNPLGTAVVPSSIGIGSSTAYIIIR